MKFNSLPTPIPLLCESVDPPITYDALAEPETESSPAVAAKEIESAETNNERFLPNYRFLMTLKYIKPCLF